MDYAKFLATGNVQKHGYSPVEISISSSSDFAALDVWFRLRNGMTRSPKNLSGIGLRQGTHIKCFTPGPAAVGDKPVSIKSIVMITTEIKRPTWHCLSIPQTAAFRVPIMSVRAGMSAEGELSFWWYFINLFEGVFWTPFFSLLFGCTLAWFAKAFSLAAP